MLKKNLFAIGAALFLAAFAGCDKEIPYNSNSGYNGARDSASQLLIDTNKTEDVNPPEGDNEDWFYFKPDEEGFSKVSVYFDNPAELDGTLNIYDSFGRPLQNVAINKNQNIQETEKFPVKDERYFVAIKVNAGASSYTVNVGFELPPPPVIENEVVEDESNASASASKKQKCVPADKCKKGQRCCKTPSAPADDGIPEGATVVKGTIILVTPREGEISDIKISGLGSKKGVKKGMKAYLRGLNRKVDIYSCATTFCNATIKATSEELARYDSVDVVVSQ